MNLKQEIAGLPLYGTFLATLLAAGWLLPNHYPPWNTFHSNAWVAATLAVVALWQLALDRGPIRVSLSAMFLAGAAVIPWLQLGAGLLALRSDALLLSLYLVGVAGAFAMGEHWSRRSPGQPVGFVLGAASLAAAVSVGLQIYQWLGYAQEQSLQDIWVFPAPEGYRPYANLGQPNQLASLLLWGLFGVAWWWHKKKIGSAIASLLAGFILFGVALTESRTALLTLTLGFLLLTVWRFGFLERRFTRAVPACYLFYLTCLFGLAPLGRLLGVNASSSVLDRSAGETRFGLWRMALDAAGERPWIGFGWDQTNEAILQVFPRYPQFTNWYIEQSHSLPLDLVLWVGWPLAIAMLLAVGFWLWRIVRSLASTEQLLTVAALAVMLVHAMLELPLHHGYFLWPFALLAGSATAGIQPQAIASFSRRFAAAGVIAIGLVTGIVVHDYMKVEETFAELRFQLQRIGTNHDERPPQTLLLTDWSDFIVMSRTTPTAGMSEEQIRHWQALLVYNTSALAFRKVIGALTLNGRPDEAQFWAARSCAVLPLVLCKPLAHEWTPAAP